MTNEKLVETTCGSPCQHPSCWESQRHQEKGIPRVLPVANYTSTSPQAETDLPVQSIYNLLSDYGATDPASPMECFSYKVYKDRSRLKQKIPNDGKSSLNSKPASSNIRNSHLHLVDAQKVFNAESFSDGKAEPFMRKQFYVWVPSPKNLHRTSDRPPLKEINSHRVLIKDLTECMMPEKIHQKQNNGMFTVRSKLKKKLIQTRLQPENVPAHEKIGHGSYSGQFSRMIQCEGCCRSQLEHQLAVQQCSHNDEQRLNAKVKLHIRQGQLLNQNRSSYQSPQWKPHVELDGAKILQHSLPKKEDRKRSDRNTSVDSKKMELPMSSLQVSDRHIISLGLPDLPLGFKTAKPFTYRNQKFDFSLGPVKFPFSNHQNCYDVDYSDLCTTDRDGASSSGIHSYSSRCDAEQAAVYSESPTLQTRNITPTKYRPLMAELPADHMLDTSASELADSMREKYEPGVIAQRDEPISAESPPPPPPSPEPRE